MLQQQDNAYTPPQPQGNNHANLLSTESDQSKIIAWQQIKQQPIILQMQTSASPNQEQQGRIKTDQTFKQQLNKNRFPSETVINLQGEKTESKKKQFQEVPFTPIKQKQQRSNFLSPGQSMFDNMSIMKDNNENANIVFPYGTKISALSEIKRKPSQQFDESLLQLTKTLKGKNGGSSSVIERDDSLVYSNATISNIFITPIKMKNESQVIEPKYESDQKTAKTHNDEFMSPNAEHLDEESQMMTKEDEEYKEGQNGSKRLNARKDPKLKQQISSKTLSASSKLNRKKKLYHSSLGKSEHLKLKQAETKKKQLQRQLELLNGQIINMKQSSPKPHHNLIERINISDDVNAKMKAVELVHRLNHEKKQRKKVMQQQMSQGNKEAFQSFDEIKRFREERQLRDKEKKRLDAIERMKQQQIRKNQTKKLQQANVKFLKNVIWGGESTPLKPIEEQKADVETNQKELINDYESRVQITKEQEKRKIVEQGRTPELDHKKSRLKKIRNLESAQGKSILQEYNALLFKR